MPCLHFQLPVNGSGDLVDAKRLRPHRVGWLGEDDIPLLQHLCMDAICRADQLQFITAVSLFSHGTGLCICQLSDAVVVKLCFR